MILTPTAFHHSISSTDSIFVDTYKKTRDHVTTTTISGGYDVIIELLCDTGDIIGQLDLQPVTTTDAATTSSITIDCYGLDPNPDNIQFCQEEHGKSGSCQFFVLQDLLGLKEWYNEHLASKGYKKPLVICVNNALNNNISNHEIRSCVVEQMLAIAGSEGLCLLGYFNGNYFSHAVMNYYKKNQDTLFGPNYNVLKHANMEKRQLIIPRPTVPKGCITSATSHPSTDSLSSAEEAATTNSTTTAGSTVVSNKDYCEYHNNREWYLPREVQQCLRSYDIDVPRIFESFGSGGTTSSSSTSKTNSHHSSPCHILCDDLAIFVWFNQDSTSHAKTYYDNDDSQKFYQHIWGNGDTFHLGLYDDDGEDVDEAAAGDEQHELSASQDVIVEGQGQQSLSSLIEDGIYENRYIGDDAKSSGTCNTATTITDNNTLSSGEASAPTPATVIVLSKTQERIQRAQVKLEQEFIQLIKTKCCDLLDQQPKLRIIDFGCGYGGLLRHVYQDPSNMIWSAIGCDISRKNCNEAKRRNHEQQLLTSSSTIMKNQTDIQIIESSFLDLNGIVKNDSMDLVVSMDALIHVGNKERQCRAIQEASRILRPGGYLIFTDIMEKTIKKKKRQQTKKSKSTSKNYGRILPPQEPATSASNNSEGVEVSSQLLCDRLKVREMGTVQNYKTAMTLNGFTEFEFIDLSKNVAIHFDCILQVLQEKTKSSLIEFSNPEYKEKMEHGLQVWKDLAPDNIEWGFIIGRKTW